MGEVRVNADTWAEINATVDELRLAIRRDHPWTVSRADFLALLDCADRLQGNSSIPGIELMRRHTVDVLHRAILDPASVAVADVDAILAASRETARYRAEHGLGDPYAEVRAWGDHVWMALRADLAKR